MKGGAANGVRWFLRRGGWRLAVPLVALVIALLVMESAMADEAHPAHGVAKGAGGNGPVLWGLASLGGVFIFLVFSRALLVRRAVVAVGADANIGYLAAIRQFSRNAKLFLGYSILADLGSGIWSVMFNLYLLRTGYDIAFIGAFWMINMICHGAAALPAGIIADRYGRRRSFFIATFISLTAQGSLLFLSGYPAALLVLAGVAGLGDAFHGVTGAPFMMDNSEPRERAHLFSLNSSFLQFSRFGGSFLGGILPLLWASVLGIPQIDPGAARWALVSGLPLIILALVPLAFMREKAVEHPYTIGEVLAFVKLPSLKPILQLTMLNLLTGTAFGMTIRFFNVFFEEEHQASDAQIGAILALGSVSGAGVVLVAPILAQRWGKVPSIVATQLLSVPFLLLMAVVPSLTAVTVFFLLRGAVTGAAQPLRNQMNMELVTTRERGTTAGFTHTAFDLGGGLGALVAGLTIAGGGFATAFSVAAGIIVVPAVLYYTFFGKVEARVRQAQVQAMPLRVPAGSSQ